MKREEIIEAIAKALQDRPVCRCWTGKSRWEEDAEVALDIAFPPVRDVVWEEAVELAEKVVQEKWKKWLEVAYRGSRYDDALHSEWVGANDVLDALMKVHMERDLND